DSLLGSKQADKQNLPAPRGPTRPAFIGSHQMPLREDATFYRALEFMLCRSRPKIEFSVERIEAEEIPVWPARRRTRAHITELVEIIPALYRSTLHERLGGRQRFGQVRNYRRHIENKPMDKRARRGVRIFANEREAL